jgi:hypothetical protein
VPRNGPQDENASAEWSRGSNTRDFGTFLPRWYDQCIQVTLLCFLCFSGFHARPSLGFRPQPIRRPRRGGQEGRATRPSHLGRRATDHGLYRRRDHRPPFLAVLYRGRPRGGSASARALYGLTGRPLRGRRLAPAQTVTRLPRRRKSYPFAWSYGDGGHDAVERILARAANAQLARAIFKAGPRATTLNAASPCDGTTASLRIPRSNPITRRVRVDLRHLKGRTLGPRSLLSGLACWSSGSNGAMRCSSSKSRRLTVRFCPLIRRRFGNS